MIGSSENRISYNGNGIATEFAYNFIIIEKSDIKVLHVAADGTEQLLTKDYYVDMEKSVVLYPGYAPGAEIPEQDRPPVLPVGERLVIYREVPITQASALDKHWPFNVIEDGLDKLTIICQQIWDRLQRSFYVSESTSTNFDPKVPIEAGKTFRVKDDGTGFEVTEDPGKVIDGATALLKQTTEQAVSANEAATNAQNAATHAEVQADSVKKYKALWFDSVAAMKAEPSLTAGAYVCTAGYYSPNDGGGASYLIRTKTDDDIADGGSLHQLANGLVAELIIENGTVNVKQFGAKGDSIADDTEAIRTAFNNATNICFRSGTYNVKTNTAQRLSIPSNRNLIFDNGAILKGINQNATVSSILNIDNAENITIIGGELCGDYQENTSTVEGAGHGLQIKNSSNIVVKNLYCHDCFTDGCYVSNLIDGLFDNCKFTDNGRMGHTIISAERVTLRNCYADAINSKFSPQASFGIEPNFATNYIKNVVYDNCVGVGRIYFNLHMLKTNNYVSLTYENCKCYKGSFFLGELYPDVFDGVQQKIDGQITLNNCQTIESPSTAFDIGKYAAENTPNILLVNPVAINCNTNQYDNINGYFFSFLYFSEGQIYGNITIENAKMKDSPNTIKRFYTHNTVADYKNINIKNGEWDGLFVPNLITYEGSFNNCVLTINQSGVYTLVYRKIIFDGASNIGAVFRAAIPKNTECLFENKTNNGVSLEFNNATIKYKGSSGNKLLCSTQNAFIKLKWVDTDIAYVTEISDDTGWTLS